MVTTYPVLARFMAARWATDAVHVVPVFGENGALLEHAVFDMCFNLPRAFGVWAGKRMKGLLDLWLLAGLVILGIVFGVLREPWHSKAGLNTILAVTAACILPRVLFYPMLKRSRKPPEA